MMIRLPMLLLLVLSFALGGCGNLTGVTTGTRTTSFDAEGRTVSTVDQVAVGDPNTEYYGAVKDVAKHTSSSIAARTKAIQSATASAPGEPPDTSAWKAAFSALAVTMIQDQTAANITAVQKTKSGYDVAADALGMIGGVAKFGVVGYATTQVVDKIVDGAGDRITSSVSGEGNSQTTEVSKTSVSNTIHANTTGSSSPSSVNTDPSATGAPTGGAGNVGTSPIDAAFQSCASRGGTQGNVASCMAMSGVKDVTIEGGITKIGGFPYGPANSYSGYTPVVE